MTSSGAGRPLPTAIESGISARRWSRDPRHRYRRRRAVALLGIALLAILVVVLVAGGSRALRVPAPGQGQAGFFRTIRDLGGPGPRSLAARETAIQDAAINRTLGYTPFVRMAGSQHRELALTFDDGPGPYTPAVLAVLNQEHAPGTFFEVGIEEHYFHAGTSEIVADGYPIGDHTLSHPPMPALNKAQQRKQILNETKAIEAYGAPFPRLFRPPYGLWNSTTVSLLRQYRMLMVLWTVDTDDYRLPGVQAIVNSAVNGARPGAIILLHDAGGNRSETVQALPRIIAALRQRGYRLVTVPQLLVDNPPPANQQTAGLSGGS